MKRADGDGKTGDNRMMMRLKCPGRGHGYAELQIIGNVDEVDFDNFKRGLAKFENLAARKNYLNLGRAESLCGRALEDLVSLREKFESEGKLMDVVDISVEIEQKLRISNMFEAFKPRIVGAFNLIA